jgi:hypothetical protein
MSEATLSHHPHESVSATPQSSAAAAPPVEGLLHHLSDRIHLPTPIETLRATFAEAKPFRHIVIDDMFQPAMLNRVLDEVPPINRDNFIAHHDDHQTKFGLRSAIALKDEGYQLAAFLHSAAFLYLLSEITGIWGLLPDPYMQGGGYHVIPPGGKFDVHLDRKTDYATGLRRRLAFITYLNKDWKPEYGGQLELWNPEGTHCEASIVPVFNRTIIFEVADGNYHGHPNPVAAPDNRPRKSFAVYYHTVGEGKAGVDLRSSIFAPSYTSTPKQKLTALARDFAPPVLLRGMRNLRAKIR